MHHLQKKSLFEIVAHKVVDVIMNANLGKNVRGRYKSPPNLRLCKKRLDNFFQSKLKGGLHYKILSHANNCSSNR